MIDFIAENGFELSEISKFKKWVERIVESEDKICGDITYIFCDDAYLDKLNQQFLNHTDYTDILSFDYCEANIISGEIFISIERVAENAELFDVDFKDELLRVMAHGLLHYCKYNDKTEEEKSLMRKKEDEKIRMFHVEQ